MDRAVKDLLMQLYIKFGTRPMPYKEYMEIISADGYGTINWNDFYYVNRYVQFAPKTAVGFEERVYCLTPAVLDLIKEPNDQNDKS